MLFNSYVFILAFLPMALVGFFAASRLGRRAAGCWLIAASLFFYGWWSIGFVPLLIGSIIGNYAAALLLHRLAPWPRRQTAVLVVAVAANLAALVYYKYLGTIFGVLHVAFTNPVLPLGISFFTFTQIGYLLDCRNGATTDRSPLNYALFVTFFPHLIAGPIVHNREIMPQFGDAATYRMSSQNVVVGMTIFLLGLLKKCLLADPTSVVVGPGFAHPEALTLFPAWHVALSYSLQLYFDFSGYSDMAIGLARMFNVRFPLNFNSPYKAQSVIEYWQRWHMTLTRYLNLCLYDPIALAMRRRHRAHGFADDTTRFHHAGAVSDIRHDDPGRHLAWQRTDIPDLRPAARHLHLGQSRVADAASRPARSRVAESRWPPPADLSVCPGRRDHVPCAECNYGDFVAGRHGRVARYQCDNPRHSSGARYCLADRTLRNCLGSAEHAADHG